MSLFILILKLKWTICKRFLTQVPFPYVFLLSAIAILLGYVLLKVDIPATWQSVVGAIIIQLFFCSRIQYRMDKRLFLKQYPKLYPLSVFIDCLLLSHLLALLLQQNDMLLLDEPFNGLDILSSAYFSELLQELKKQDTLVFVSSHDLDHLVKIAGTLTIIENGKVYIKSEQLSEIQKEIERHAYNKVRSLNLSL